MRMTSLDGVDEGVRDPARKGGRGRRQELGGTQDRAAGPKSPATLMSAQRKEKKKWRDRQEMKKGELTVLFPRSETY